MKREKIDKKLLAYSATAGAALTIAPAVAHATIVHQTIDLPFGEGQGGYKDLTMEGATAELRFDGTNFTSTTTYTYYSNSTTYTSTYTFIYNSFRVMQLGDNAKVPASFSLFALNTTQYVGPATATNVNPASNNGYFFYSYNGSTSGDWTTDGDIFYAGFSFEREDNTNTVYGWMRVERLTVASGRVLEWAYEDNGTRIRVGAVPEPATGLALLALGAAGIARYKKRG